MDLLKSLIEDDDDYLCRPSGKAGRIWDLEKEVAKWEYSSKIHLDEVLQLRPIVNELKLILHCKPDEIVEIVKRLLK